ncbi:uncharacterized protein C22orf15 homolog [Physeter macrocephalus]|uniref:Uncharacterized protein C22orf15 homolog n=1 Tax=Physeter macrocephalus TaxID=9755 RepID=A0A9W2WC17_PHYMC|nr:uncharacterized protein C22orf15 homolog [Physeter catodon]
MVMSGAGCWELVNPWCSLVILITHLRQRGQVPPDECEGGAPTCYESLLENLDERCPELAGRASWAFQRSCAGCRACPHFAMAGEGAPALCVATRSKTLLHGPEGWVSCCLGPTSWG